MVRPELEIFVALTSIAGPDDDWILGPLRSDTVAVTPVPAGYAHDRSRARASGKEWGDYARHALRTLLRARRSPARRVAVVTSFPQLAVVFGLLKPLLCPRARVVVWYFNVGQNMGPRRARLARLGLARVDVLVSHSTAEVEVYTRAFRLPPGRVRYAPLQVAMADTVPDEAEEEPPFLVALGSANRDYRTLVVAVAGTPWPAVIVAGPHATAGLPPAPNVTVRSGLTMAECQALMARSRLVVVPLKEGTTAAGQVTLVEAMALGRPVVVTRTVGSVDYVTDGTDAVLVPPGDPVALRAAIAALWDDTARRRAIGAAARATAEAHSSEASARRTIAAALGL